MEGKEVQTVGVNREGSAPLSFCISLDSQTENCPSAADLTFLVRTYICKSSEIYPCGALKVQTRTMNLDLS